MYTDSFIFNEDPSTDFSQHMEDFDQLLDSHTGELKHVTHSIVVANNRVSHYYTLFFEEVEDPSEEGDIMQQSTPDYV